MATREASTDEDQTESAAAQSDEPNASVSEIRVGNRRFPAPSGAPASGREPPPPPLGAFSGGAAAPPEPYETLELLELDEDEIDTIPPPPPSSERVPVFTMEVEGEAPSDDDLTRRIHRDELRPPPVPAELRGPAADAGPAPLEMRAEPPPPPPDANKAAVAPPAQPALAALPSIVVAPSVGAVSAPSEARPTAAAKAPAGSPSSASAQAPGTAADDWRFASDAPPAPAAAPEDATEPSKHSLAVTLLTGAALTAAVAVGVYLWVDRLPGSPPAEAPVAKLQPPPAPPPEPATPQPAAEPAAPGAAAATTVETASPVPAREPVVAKPTPPQASSPKPRPAPKPSPRPAAKPNPPPAAASKPKPAAVQASAAASAQSEPGPEPVEPAEDLTEDLPDAPSRQQVITGIAAVRPALLECAQGRHGVAQLDLNIANTGRVVHALVLGDFAGTPEGSCLARTIRKATFPRFKRERFRILYPLSL